MYEYNATLKRISDADTVHLRIDCGMRIFTDQVCRLFGINAPESDTPEGRLSTEFLVGLIPLEMKLRIETIRDKNDKYGRLLVKIWLADGTYVNELLVNSGHAVWKEY